MLSCRRLGLLSYLLKGNSKLSFLDLSLKGEGMVSKEQQFPNSTSWTSKYKRPTEANKILLLKIKCSCVNFVIQAGGQIAEWSKSSLRSCSSPEG